MGEGAKVSRVSDFFYKESKSIFFGGGGGVGRRLE